MKKYILFCTVLMLLSVARLCAQDSYNDRAQKYIEQYYRLAIQEQQRAGIPASITLGQGILETEAGASELMTKANNHFGIKCKMDWQGDKFLHTDDAPNECFKKYSCAAESYKDHSDYLKRNPRYTPLFSLQQTDYKGWAVCLKKCGYATNPQYAQNLIKIIEDFNLQTYTYSGFDSSLLKNHSPVAVTEDDKPATTTPIQKTADSARDFILHKQEPIQPQATVTEPDADDGKITTVNGLKAFYAHRGDMLLQYAMKYKIRYARLLEMNDLADGPLPFSCYVYLEKKLSLGTRPTHIVKNGENLLMISQAEGVQLKRLMAMNMLNPNEEPVTGAVIYLQSATSVKPDVSINALIAHKGNAIVNGTDDTKQDNDYIATNKATTIPVPVVKAPAPVSAPAAHAPTIDTMAMYKQQLDAIAPTPAHHTPTTHVIVVKSEAEEPKQQPAYAQQTAITDNPPPPVEKEQATSEEEFTKLKAQLDKVVYADDSRLVAKAGTINQPQKQSLVQAKTLEPAGESAATKSAKYYKVKHGDTAFSIAKRNNITVTQLLKWNDIDANDIKSGENLRIK